MKNIERLDDVLEAHMRLFRLIHSGKVDRHTAKVFRRTCQAQLVAKFTLQFGVREAYGARLLKRLEDEKLIIEEPQAGE